MSKVEDVADELSEADMDMLLYGVTFQRADGTRIDPMDVRMYTPPPSPDSTE